MEAKKIVLTGASRGLGAGMAAFFHSQGHELALCSRQKPTLEGPGILAASVDMRDAKAVEAFAAHVIRSLGQIDLWINNAALLTPIAPLREAPIEAWCQLQRVNVEGVFLGSRAMALHLRERGGEGVLVNISSGAGQNPYAGLSSYCASKAAVDMLSGCLAIEEESAGLRVHAISPGVVDTDMQISLRGSTAENLPVVEDFLQLQREANYNSPAHVAEEILAIAFGESRRGGPIIQRVADQVR